MAGTNVPQPTFTASGFQAPQPQAVLAGVQADITAAFQKTLNYNLNTPQGQLSSSMAASIANVYAVFVYYTQQVDPAFAIGRMQDAIARIYDIERNGAEATALEVAVTGAPGTSIPPGALVQDPAGNLYAHSGISVIGAGGSTPMSFACTVPGPTAVPTTLSIYQAIPGWDSAAVLSGAVGVATETRQQLEARRLDAVAGNSAGPIGAIIGAVAKVSGVLDYFGYSNNSGSTVVVGGVSIGANSIYVAVSGGADSDVAQAILSKKGAGAPMVGNTTVTAFDSNPLYSAPQAYSITFTRPSTLQVLFKVTILNGPQVPSDANVQVQNALIAAFGGSFQNLGRARIGSVLFAPLYVPPIAALGAWAQVSAISIGSANSPDAVVTGHVDVVGGIGVLTVTGVTSGALVVGDRLFDAAGAILPGTKIVSFGTGTGGNGTYNLNNPQTVGSRTITAASADQQNVSVRADQEPQLLASNIDVVLS